MESSFSSDEDVSGLVDYDEFRFTPYCDPSVLKCLWKEHFRRPVRLRNPDVTEAFENRCSICRFTHPELTRAEVMSMVMEEVMGKPPNKTRSEVESTKNTKEDSDYEPPKKLPRKKSQIGRKSKKVPKPKTSLLKKVKRIAKELSYKRPKSRSTDTATKLTRKDATNSINPKAKPRFDIGENYKFKMIDINDLSESNSPTSAEDVWKPITLSESLKRKYIHLDSGEGNQSKTRTNQNEDDAPFYKNIIVEPSTSTLKIQTTSQADTTIDEDSKLSITVPKPITLKIGQISVEPLKLVPLNVITTKESIGASRTAEDTSVKKLAVYKIVQTNSTSNA